MVLAGLAGFAVQHFFGVANAVLVGVLVGMVVAPVVDRRRACPLPPPSQTLKRK